MKMPLIKTRRTWERFNELEKCMIPESDTVFHVL